MDETDVKSWLKQLKKEAGWASDRIEEDTKKLNELMKRIEFLEESLKKAGE